jgi:hypothetical protein
MIRSKIKTPKPVIPSPAENLLGITINFSKKGVIVVGTPRCGSHMLISTLFRLFGRRNDELVGEINYTDYTIEEFHRNNNFVFASLVDHTLKSLLARNRLILADYQLINLRRRDKVKQYLSYCILRKQMAFDEFHENYHFDKHSVNKKIFINYTPWASTVGDIHDFLAQQYIDYAFPSASVLYYEDILKLDLGSDYKKNSYLLPPEKLVTDYELVKEILGPFSYDGR